MALAGAGALLAGCSAGVQSLTFPAPPVTGTGGEAPAVTLPPGLAATAESPVGGVTTTTAPAVGPGPATLNGTVLGPAGPVGGATVQADRLVGDAVASARTTTATDGSWTLPDVLGGRYRVRAWKGPDLDLTTPQIVFVDAAQPLPLNLQLTAYTTRVSAAVNPPDPLQGQPVSLVVQVVDPAVNPDGILAYKPVPGKPVSLVNGFGWQVSGANPAVTDGRGQALFTVSCTAAGPDPLSAQVVGSAPVPLQMPACTAPTPPTTTPAPGGGGGGSIPTTTCPGGSTTGDPNSTTTSLAFGNC
ncbi:MAG TPA: carboxypeptidase-like regulatory domain-containing protein [Acidimicrobiales bacterium]|nr:carboxypeptidase-like regulatory domain-containing protein [Acidimicrobiales bacterium]